MHYPLFKSSFLLGIWMLCMFVVYPADSRGSSIVTPELEETFPNTYQLCPNPKGQTRVETLTSELFHAEIQFSIYLPPCIEQNPQSRYPVIYLLNGQTYNHDQWVRLGVASVADELISSRTIYPVIIVMPDDQDWRQPTASPFGEMLVQELIPQIDRTYPTLPEREYRAIGGLSRGASWALHLGLTNYQMFSKIGAHSLPVFAADENTIPAWLKAMPPEETPYIFLDTGNQDPEINHAHFIESLLSANHLPHEWHLFVGEHDEAYWSNHLKEYLTWYACGWTVLYYN